MTATRQSELKADSSVQSSQVIPSMIQPGETKTITLAVNDPTKQSLQVETMYGKTKDICAVGSIGSHALYALQQHVTSEVSVKDDVVETGAFTRPSVGMHAYPNADICPGAKDGVTCLRAISQAATSPSTIRFFSPYLPSVLDAIESKYGSLDAESLNLPSSGALRITVTLKH
ncbi:MAG: hypothetical protein EOP05_21165 [Proteobacteria bacterium]|nr:MAG: hypothetical protein EOP05_21165 [Pseudomonadota bacterium]